MMSSGNGNPSIALLASTRSPLPLAPRLTTTSSPQNVTSNNASSSSAADEQVRTQSNQTSDSRRSPSLQSMMHIVVQNSVLTTNENQASSPINNGQQTDNHLPFAISRQRVLSRPRTLLNGTRQPLATQALTTTSTSSTGRFAAYLHQPVRSSDAVQAHSSTITNQRSRITLTDSVQTNSSDDLFNPSITRLRSGSVNDSPFEVLPQFRKDASLPGDVLVRCSDYNFFVHKSVLYFSSPFFRAILDGDWKETHPSLHTRSSSRSSSSQTTASDLKEDEVIGDSAESIDADMKEQLSALRLPASTRTSFHTAFMPFDSLGNETQMAKLTEDTNSVNSDTVDNFLESAGTVTAEEDGIPSKLEDGDNTNENVIENTADDLELSGRLKRMATPPLPDSLEDELSANISNHSTAEHDIKVSPHTGKKEFEEVQRTNIRPSRRALREERKENLTAIIDLTEEDAATFQDVLCHIYPNLDLLVTWINIFPLFAFSDKFEVPYLRRACTTFLRASLAGRPIEAMALSERHGIEDVYREASRHVLDNMPSWEPEELAILSNETLLKLERKRTWFLERLLKLGLANPARDYECQNACPDPQHCAKLLHERWHAQYAAAFKYGPPQPSIIWRHLRELEGNGAHSQSTSMLACQASSKAWVQSLFDRMYGLPTLPTHGKTSQKFLAIKLIATTQIGTSRQRPNAVREGVDNAGL